MSKFVAIDFETANYEANSAIAVGLAVIEDGRLAETRGWLIRPPRMWFVPRFIEIHGIHPEQVADQPDFAGLWHEIAPYLRGATLIAHNAVFDRRVLEATAAHYDILLPRLDWICTLGLARQRWPDLGAHKLNIVCDHLAIALNHHEATSDAEAAARIYLAA